MATTLKIAIASDLSGYPLKQEIAKHLKENHPEIEVLDFGIDSPEAPKPYFEQAPKVATAIQSGKAEKGILICGTGQGMAIVQSVMIGNARDPAMDIGPAQILGTDHFAGRSLHQGRSRQKDGALILDDDAFIAHGRDISAAGGA